MRFGIHLPQYGRAAGADAIRRAAVQAEQLGFSDVWVSDHLAVPKGAPYPPPFLFEPVVTLTWAAAATSTIGLGTSVLVLPYRHPLHLAKELASLDRLSGGRLVVGAAAGWLRAEFDALGVPFEERGGRSDEAIDVLRACWEQRPVEIHGRYAQLHQLEVLPQPAHRIPIWVGGTSDRAVRRAAERGDGWHGNTDDAHKLDNIVRRLREDRPETAFTISTRVQWDALNGDLDAYRQRLEVFRRVGVQHVLVGPVQNSVDDWLRAVEAVSTLVGPLRG